MGRADGRQQRSLLCAPAVRRIHARRRSPDVSKRRHDAARRKQPGRTRATSQSDSDAGAGGRSSCCRSGTPMPKGTSGLCRLLNKFGISALRLSLPYHDARMPPELRRADYIVSSNVGRTAQVCRQAVLDARRARCVARASRATNRSASSAPASGRAWRC